jgi:hypothetical protein
LAPGREETNIPRGEMACIPLPDVEVLIKEPVGVLDKLHEVPEEFRM